MQKTIKQIFFLLFLICPFMLIAQVPPTNAIKRLDGFEKRKELLESSLVKNIPFKNIGPTVFSGRVVDVDVNPNDPTHFYVAYASGGLWYTENNATKLEPIFDHEAVMTIGDIAVNWETNEIYVGTGENNSSRSSYSGTGIYKSSDMGKTWQHKGLSESHHISRVIIHPENSQILWVAVLGHLYSPNAERGVYKSIDGGKSWTKTLFVNENSGAVDLVIDPINPEILYAATWHRERRSWDFNEAGEGSGVYKSTDGGNQWTKLSTSGSGFPTGNLTGRIGLDIFHVGEKEILFAILDNYNRRPKDEDDEDETNGVLTKEDFRSMTVDAFLVLEDKKLDKFLEGYGFPKKYDAKTIKEMAKNGNLKPLALTEYLEDANSLLFDTPVIGAEVYSSEDGGKTWQKKNTDYIDFLYNSYGYYFGQIRISPQNSEKIYVLGVPILKSENGGKTFEPINGDNVHSDHHALWLNPNREGHLINGNDGGLNISYDDGKTWMKMNQPSVGQFYSVAVDMAKPYNVYGGLQDNGVWMGPNTYEASSRWHSSGSYPYKSIMGGDGMQVAIDNRDNETVYTGFQFGNYYRVNTRTDKRNYITPKHELGDRPYRWNWEAPIWLSSHNQDIFYMGSNKLHRSFNQGNNFAEISEDLTKGGKKGDVAFGTLTCIHESPIKFGLIYTGSDDGLIHVTKDGGNNWTKISNSLPQDRWVSSIQASAHDINRVYVTLNGYRWDEFESYCFMSTDMGTTWEKIGKNLPVEPVNVLKEDPKNENILYVGTDHAAYASLDRGETFMSFSGGLSAAPVHDLIIHPRENDLILATHGRSLYKADVSNLQETILKDDNVLTIFAIDPISQSNRWGKKFANWGELNEPKLMIESYTQYQGNGHMIIENSDGEEIFRSDQNLDAGFNYTKYDLSFNSDKKDLMEELINKDNDEKRIILKKADNEKYYLPIGTYTIKLDMNRYSAEQKFEIKERS